MAYVSRQHCASAAAAAAQLFYHEVQHRAQVMAMLRQLGIAAEGLDFNRYAFQWTEPAPT